MRLFSAAKRVLVLASAFAATASVGCDGADPPTESEARRLELTKRQTQVYGRGLSSLPDEGLRRTEERPFSFDQLGGHPTLLSALYTNCPMEKMCPLLATKIGKVQGRVASTDGIDDGDFSIVLLTFDPERDTPEKLRNYATERGIDPQNARFVSGDPETIASVMESLEIATETTDSGRITHNLRTYVTDSRGRIFSGFRQSRWNPDDVVARLKAAIR